MSVSFSTGNFTRLDASFNIHLLLAPILTQHLDIHPSSNTRAQAVSNSRCYLLTIRDSRDWSNEVIA